MGLLQEGDYQLKRRHPHGDIQRFDHQASSAVTVTAGQELLPEAPPALVREDVALVSAMEQSLRFGTQAIDQVLQIDAPGLWTMAAAAIGAWEPANPVATEVDDQPVMVQPHRNLTANQAWRNGVDNLPHLNRAGAPYPHREQLVVGKAIGRQRAERRQFLFVAPLPRGVDSAEHLRQQFAIFGGLLEIEAAAQDRFFSSRRFTWPCGASMIPFSWATPGCYG